MEEHEERLEILVDRSVLHSDEMQLTRIDSNSVSRPSRKKSFSVMTDNYSFDVEAARVLLTWPENRELWTTGITFGPLNL